jgi:putative transposase
MSRSRHTEGKLIGALKQVESGQKVEDLAREEGVSKHTLYVWKAKYGGMNVIQVQEAKQLRDENSRLRKLVADLSLDRALQSVIGKNGWRRVARPLIFPRANIRVGAPSLRFLQGREQRT